MPEPLFDYLGQSLTRALLLVREYAEISDIGITEGMLTISGRWKR